MRIKLGAFLIFEYDIAFDFEKGQFVCTLYLCTAFQRNHNANLLLSLTRTQVSVCRSIALMAVVRCPKNTKEPPAKCESHTLAVYVVTGVVRVKHDLSLNLFVCVYAAFSERNARYEINSKETNVSAATHRFFVNVSRNSSELAARFGRAVQSKRVLCMCVC